MMLDKKKLLLSQFLPVIRENVMGSQIIEETNCLSLSSIVKVITSQQRQFEKSVEVGRQRAKQASFYSKWHYAILMITEDWTQSHFFNFAKSTGEFSLRQHGALLITPFLSIKW